jgi:enoyl-[acyl-carrier protein] reductase I
MTDGRPLYVISGVANEASIAWAVADRLLKEGRSCLLACFPKNLHRAEKLLKRHGYEAQLVAIDVNDDESIRRLASTIEESGRQVAGLLHSIAFANVEELQGATLETSREGFVEAMNVSVYSLLALVRAVRGRLMSDASVVAMTYHGSQRCIPGYNVMGIAKAALESACRYLAHELGPHGIRVNCASPGALLTLSSSAFPDVQEGIERGAAWSPLRRATRLEDVAATVCFLLSPEAAGVTGQTVYVDNGVSIMGG